MARAAAGTADTGSRELLEGLPAPVRGAVVAAVVLAVAAGLVGGVTGLVIGLRVHPPTAWAAVLEVAVPAALAGGLLGALVGAPLVVATGALRRRRHARR